MEQTSKCSNHPYKNSLRLCDSCGEPFCSNCLRYNMVGYCYCLNCYSKLSKNTSQELMKQSKNELRKKGTDWTDWIYILFLNIFIFFNYPFAFIFFIFFFEVGAYYGYRHPASTISTIVIAIVTIISGIIPFIFFGLGGGYIVGTFINKYNVTWKQILIALVFGFLIVTIYDSSIIPTKYDRLFFLVSGFIFGKKWPEISWFWGVLIMIPWFIYTVNVLDGGDVGLWGAVTITSIIFLFIICISAYIGARGAYIGARVKYIRWKEIFSIDSPVWIIFFVIIIFLLAYVIFKA